MKPRLDGDVIELRAVAPEGDLACDTTIATPEASAGLTEALARGIIRPVRKLENGVEVSFDPSARDAVMRYVELESRCCSFLDLAVRTAPEAVVLTVTGRPDARDWIYQIFEDA
jgi:hypothetical protein